MRQSSFAARVSLSQEHQWVDRSTIEAHLEVEMGTESAAGRPDGSHAPLRVDPLFLRHIHFLEVRINCGEAATVVDDDHIAVASQLAREENHAAQSRMNG